MLLLFLQLLVADVMLLSFQSHFSSQIFLSPKTEEILMCRGDITEDEGNEGADQLKRKSLFIVVKTIRSESEH